MQDICILNYVKLFLFTILFSIELVYNSIMTMETIVFFHGSEYMGLPLSETIFYSYFH
jgi:hypothetical protein